MSVFLTPGGRPFHGGTYYPPERRYGMHSFRDVLNAIADAWQNRREELDASTVKIVEALRGRQGTSSGASRSRELSASTIDAAYQAMADGFDRRRGGWGGAPKFPQPMALEFLLRYHYTTGDVRALAMVKQTLEAMASGGMYDQIGGGFHRYSVDERWLVPHFEKMLYDNALLTWVYLEAHQVTGDVLYGRVVREILDYALREMTQPGGGFYATQDADSEGQEGKFFVWTPEEIEATLGSEKASLFQRYYGVTAGGNFEHGASVLHVDVELPDLARGLNVEEEELRRVVDEGRERLLGVRQQRVAPGRDEKLLVSWNGLMISAMARAYQALGEPAYLQAAGQAADFILQTLVQGGRLLHTCKDGRPQLAAYQDDYACLVNGLLDLYEASLELRWLRAARELNEVMLELFWDADAGGFFYTAAGAEDLIVRTKNPLDNATPSGNSIGVLVLLRLAAMTGDAGLRDRAEKTLELFSGLMARAPAGCAQMICALDWLLDSPCEIAVVGPPSQRQAFLAAVHGRFLPHKVLVGADRSDHPDDLVEHLPLLAGRVEAGPNGATAYVCRDSVCSLPVTGVADFAALLQASGGAAALESTH